MRYFLIAGEASGDLHAANLMRALRERDSQAEFRYIGGDKMKEVGGDLLLHYKDIAYMGFIPVLLHLNVILKAMAYCKKAICEWNPDVLILVDYPGFNLKIAKYIRNNTDIPVYYYISPKVWAWKERRVKDIKQTVNELFSILPFEVKFFEGKHHFPIHYVGNPSVDEITAFKDSYTQSREAFLEACGLEDRPIIAVLPGSRNQEIKDNLRQMLQAVKPYVEKGYQAVVAGVNTIDDEQYAAFFRKAGAEVGKRHFHLIKNRTNELLMNAEAALVTSGTATLETALFRVPQVVCYYAPLGPVVRLAKRLFLKVPFISLVNLIAEREVVPELIADDMNAENLKKHLSRILKGGEDVEKMLKGYDDMMAALGPAGAPHHAAEIMYKLLNVVVFK